MILTCREQFVINAYKFQMSDLITACPTASIALFYDIVKEYSKLEQKAIEQNEIKNKFYTKVKACFLLNNLEVVGQAVSFQQVIY